jgi:NADH-quinone oxidoreductase subunit J
VTVATYILLGLLVFTALWTLQTTLLRAAIGLALVSVTLTLLMFEMGAPLAGVFELSVCAGLITVIFISTVSLTKRLKPVEAAASLRSHARRFRPAVIFAAAAGLPLILGKPLINGIWGISHPPAAIETVREVIWGARRMDLLGQLIVIFVGVFGVVILFREEKKKKEAGR